VSQLMTAGSRFPSGRHYAVITNIRDEESE